MLSLRLFFQCAIRNRNIGHIYYLLYESSYWNKPKINLVNRFRTFRSEFILSNEVQIKQVDQLFSFADQLSSQGTFEELLSYYNISTKNQVLLYLSSAAKEVQASLFHYTSSKSCNKQKSQHGCVRWALCCVYTLLHHVIFSPPAG